MYCASALEVTIALNLRSQVREPQPEAAVAWNSATRAGGVTQASGRPLDDSQSVANLEADLEATGAQATQPDEEASGR